MDSKFLIAYTLSILACVAQNPLSGSFSSRVPTDADLPPMSPNCATTLTAGVNASTLTLPVASSACFLVDQLVILGSSAPYETAQICAKPDGTHLTLCSGTRGLNNTTAASHASGQLVSGGLSGHNINSLAAWMKDVAGALGANLANVIKNPDPTKTGYTVWQGMTSGSQGWSVPDAAGSLYLYLMPTAPSSGGYLQDSGAATCPTLPSGAPTPAGCRQTTWATASGSVVGADYLTGADTTGSTVVSSALQSALTSAAGKTLQLPCGILLIDTMISVPNNTRIRGCGIPMYSGAGGTIIRLKASTTVVAMIRTGDISYQQNFESWFAEDLTFDANASNGGVVTEAVVSLQKVFSPAYIRNVSVTNYSAGVPGIWIGPGWRTEGNGPAKLDNVWVTPGSNAPGIRLSSYYSVTVTSATNASPIVIGLSQAHGLQDGEAIYVASVGGNTAANGWKYAKVTGQDSTHVALYSDSGLTTAVSGNGAYTSGGTLSVEGYVENTWLSAIAVESFGTGTGIVLDSITGGMLRGIHGSNIKCASGNTGKCIDIARTYNTTWDNIMIHRGSGQTQGITIDANSYGNTFRDITGPGGYNTVNLIVDAQTGLTTSVTETRIAQYNQVNNGENYIYYNGNKVSYGGGSTSKYAASISGTSTSITAATHGLGTTVVVNGCRDGSGSPVWPDWSVDGSGNVTITSAISQTGTCYLWGQSIYAAAITGTSTSITAATHGLGPAAIVAGCKDGSNNSLSPDWAVDGSGNVTITSAVSQTGTCYLR